MRNINFENINVLPILDIDKNVDPEKLINALIDGKINTVEITLRNEKAFDNIKFIRKKFPNLILGVGTIVNLNQLKKAIDLGADFGISPGFETEILKYAQENKFSYIPGVSTASEIISCLKFDCNFLKLFPAEPLGGISYLNSLSGPFPNVSFWTIFFLEDEFLTSFRNFLREAKTPYCCRYFALKRISLSLLFKSI